MGARVEAGNARRLALRARETRAQCHHHDRGRRGDDEPAARDAATDLAVLGAEEREVAADRTVADRGLDVSVGELGRAERQGQAEHQQRPAVQRDVEAGPGHAEDREVPQIKAVRAQTDPPQRPAPEDRPRVGSWVHHRRDHEHGCDVHKQEPAAEHTRVARR